MEKVLLDVETHVLLMFCVALNQYQIEMVLGCGASEKDRPMTGYTVTNRVTFGHATKKQSQNPIKIHKFGGEDLDRFGFNLLNAFLSVFSNI